MNQIQKNEIDIFLKRMSKIFKNDEIKLNSDTIYHELTNHFYKDDEYCKITPLETEEIINNLQKKYSKGNVEGLDTWIDYFFIFDNSGNLTYDDFYNLLQENSLKLYVSVDEECLFNVANLVYDFILKNNIIVQSKIAPELRSDIFVIRVVNYLDAIKLIDYINSLDYESKYKPNPFSFRSGKVSVTKDYGTSYNRVVTLTLQKYLNQKKNLNELDTVCYDDFANFVRTKCYNEETYQYEKNIFERAIKRKDYNYQSDFFVACYDLLRRNIESELTLESFENHRLSETLQNSNDIRKDEKTSNDINDKKSNDDSIDFDTDLIEETFNCFLECINDTCQKYSKEQAYQAITNLVINKDYSYFTDKNENRTKLMNMISYNELIKIIHYVMRENDYSIDDLIDISFLEVNKKGSI